MLSTDSKDIVPQNGSGFVRKSTTIISPNQFALVTLPSEMKKIVELRPDGNISLGKFGTFAVNGVLGFPFGQSFEITENNQVTPVESITFEADVEDVDTETELTKDELTKLFSNSAENNQNIINIGSEIQKLTSDEIDTLKKSGGSSDVGQKIIEQIIAGHGGFDKKTIFSQQKYLKRKQQKFLRRFTIEYLGGSQLLKYYTEKDPQRIHDMSDETLGLLLNYANVREGGRYLLVDETGGVILYAMMERMNGKGSIIVAHDNEHPNHMALRYSNYSTEMIEKMVKPISWLQFMEPENEKIDWVDMSEEQLSALKLSKRQQYERRLKRSHEINDVIADVETGNFDAVIIISTLSLSSLAPHVIGCAGGSRPLVFYNQYKEPLLDLQHSIQNDKRVLAPSIFETRVRPHQTIPGRMHPVMSMKGYGGYILWTTRVFPKEGGVTAIGRGSKRKRVEETPEAEAGQKKEIIEADSDKADP